MEKIGRSSINEVFCLLTESENVGVVVFDLDHCLKNPIINARNIRFGEIPQSNLDNMTNLQRLGWTVLVATNQPRFGHQIAKIFSGNGCKYPIFPDSLEKIIKPEAIFGGNILFCFPGHHYKKNKGAIEVRNFLEHEVNGLKDILVVVGDKDSDEQFADKIGASLFIRLPSSFYMQFIDQLPPVAQTPLKKIIP